jgi:hypothetical protein
MAVIPSKTQYSATVVCVDRERRDDVEIKLHRGHDISDT